MGLQREGCFWQVERVAGGCDGGEGWTTRNPESRSVCAYGGLVFLCRKKEEGILQPGFNAQGERNNFSISFAVQAREVE